jgi:transposase-like protein
VRPLVHHLPIELSGSRDRFARPVNTSWRVYETYINIRGKWNYLYRAVDKHGKTVDFLLRPDRGIAAAQVFSQSSIDKFAEVAAQDHARWPLAEPPSPSASAAGGSEVEVC